MLSSRSAISNESKEHGRPLSRAAAGGAIRARSARARPRRGRSRNRLLRRSIRRCGVQPPASSSRRRRAAPYLWLFSVWIDEPAAKRKVWPEIVNSTSRVATRCISMRDRMSFQRASWRKASTGNVAVELAVDSLEQVEVELGGDAFGIVVGGEQPLDRLHPVHPDQQLRAGAEQRAELPQQIGRAPRHEIADGRAGEEAELGQMLETAGKRERPREVGDHRDDFERREIAAGARPRCRSR